MAESVQVEGFDSFGRAAKAAPKELQKQVRKALRDATKPLGGAVIAEGLGGLSAMRGGVAGFYGAAKGRAVPGAGWNRVQLVLGGTRKRNLDIVNRGMIRHPLFGRSHSRVAEQAAALGITTKGKGKKLRGGGQTYKDLWFTTKVTPGLFDRAFANHKQQIAGAVMGAMEATLNTMETK